MKTIEKLLIANRGEVAVRIMRACQELGIRTVAICSEADAHALHVRTADEVIPIGSDAPQESYLRGDRIIAAAQSVGAQAIHPGFGFLSENADFADAVRAAGLIFIGPSGESIRKMGSKTRARAIMQLAGVPIVPGYEGGLEADFGEAAGTIGYPVLVKAAAGGGGKGMRIVRAPDVDGWWLMHFVNSPSLRSKIVSFQSGSTRKRISKKNLCGIDIPVPPLPEQHRIVAEIEKHFTRLDEAVTTLEGVRAKLKRARASVLKAAVEGRLVPTEAALARAEGRSYEPASVLVQRILDERRRRWPEGKKYVPPIESETDGLPPLPEGWVGSTLDGLADVAGGVTKNQKVAEGREVPYLRVANVQRGRLDLSVVKTITAPESVVAALRLQPGDILLNEGGDRDKLGRGWVWEGQIPECIHQNHVFRARVWRPDVQPKYLSHYGNSLGQSYFLDQGKQTTNLASISLSKIKRLPVALPPAAEQIRIVAEVERRLSVLDALDRTVEENLSRCGRLRQSILKRAFEGRLVPQDPRDEPASALLARIRAERSAAGQQDPDGARRRARPAAAQRPRRRTTA